MWLVSLGVKCHTRMLQYKHNLFLCSYLLMFKVTHVYLCFLQNCVTNFMFKELIRAVRLDGNCSQTQAIIDKFEIKGIFSKLGLLNGYSCKVEIVLSELSESYANRAAQDIYFKNSANEHNNNVPNQ